MAANPAPMNPTISLPMVKGYGNPGPRENWKEYKKGRTTTLPRDQDGTFDFSV